MRRIGIILAGAALALALVSPAVAGAMDKSSHGTTITAQGFHGGHGGGHGSFHGRHGFARHDHGRFFHRGFCFGCGYPYWFYGYPYGFYGYPYGYYPGGFGCNFDYPCGPPYPQSQDTCARASSRSAQPAPGTPCRSAGPSGQAPPPQQARPAPNQGQQPPADQGMEPGPSQGQQPPADQGQQPAPAGQY